jgi:hypothetical protein
MALVVLTGQVRTQYSVITKYLEGYDSTHLWLQADVRSEGIWCGAAVDVYCRITPHQT